jgi:hypothetical protein
LQTFRKLSHPASLQELQTFALRFGGHWPILAIHLEGAMRASQTVLPFKLTASAAFEIRYLEHPRGVVGQEVAVAVGVEAVGRVENFFIADVGLLAMISASGGGSTPAPSLVIRVLLRPRRRARVVGGATSTSHALGFPRPKPNDDESLTAHAGLVLFDEYLGAMGIAGLINHELPGAGSAAGYDPVCRTRTRWVAIRGYPALSRRVEDYTRLEQRLAVDVALLSNGTARPEDTSLKATRTSRRCGPRSASSRAAAADGANSQLFGKL